MDPKLKKEIEISTQKFIIAQKLNEFAKIKSINPWIQQLHKIDHKATQGLFAILIDVIWRNRNNPGTEVNFNDVKLRIEKIGDRISKRLAE